MKDGLYKVVFDSNVNPNGQCDGIVSIRDNRINGGDYVCFYRGLIQSGGVNGSVIQQILPTFYVNRLQQQFSKYFSSLQIALADVDPPVYNISAITNSGSKIVAQVYV
ncbi:hypothetical protein RMP33_002612 [Salmonella enterica]|nr:hypothetical protein [Salmonella enterica]